MKTVKVRNVVIGEGMPKICVPVVGGSEEELLAEARAAAGQLPDVIELRADWFEDLTDHDSLEDILAGVREILCDIPLLFTIRTSAEGGEADITDDVYADLNIRAVRSGLIDMVDVEVSKGSGISSRIITEAHNAGVKVIASRHDFTQTPDKSVMLDGLRGMQETGADIIKIAVMPQSSGDVISLLDAAAEMTANYAECPVIAISMSESGMISRLACEVLGTAMTFGAATKASAPGQIGVGDLKHALSVFHKAIHK